MRMNETTVDKDILHKAQPACSTGVLSQCSGEERRVRERRGEGGTCRTALSLWHNNGVLLQRRLTPHACTASLLQHRPPTIDENDSL